MRRVALVSLKLAVAALLVGWLVHAGTLDLTALWLFFDRPVLLIEDVAALALAIMLGAMRWQLLLRAVDVPIGLGRALQLHTTGLFFNVVVPGGIGGDVVKAVYVARDQPEDKRPAVYLIGFVDRLIGIAGLVMLALLAVLLHGSDAWQPPLRALSLIAAALATVTIAAPIVVLAAARRSTRRPRSGTLAQLVDATQLVAARPPTLVIALALAIALHAIGLALFGVLADALASGGSLASVASVYPLGMLTIALPISTAGIGVGHVAFERLFELVGLHGGANTFNLFFIGQTAPCLLGVLPYLTLRRRSPPASDARATT
ncbi:MAG: lysylphosphatidylglycerol synthase transmembrane domain-containing protein [Acidobacteriota bacterium]